MSAPVEPILFVKPALSPARGHTYPAHGPGLVREEKNRGGHECPPHCHLMQKLFGMRVTRKGICQLRIQAGRLLLRSLIIPAHGLPGRIDEYFGRKRLNTELFVQITRLVGTKWDFLIIPSQHIRLKIRTILCNRLLPGIRPAIVV